MSYQLTGKIKAIGGIEQKSDTFKVRTFVVTIDGDTNYPQQVQLQATNDKCDMLNTFTVGSDVTVAFNLRGREWTNPADNTVKYFNTLDAWRIEAGTSAPQGDAQGNSVPANQTPVTVVPETGDDLPF
jgi:hypothetical protein